MLRRACRAAIAARQALLAPRRDALACFEHGAHWPTAGDAFRPGPASGLLRPRRVSTASVSETEGIAPGSVVTVAVGNTPDAPVLTLESGRLARLADGAAYAAQAAERLLFAVTCSHYARAEDGGAPQVLSVDFRERASASNTVPRAGSRRVRHEGSPKDTDHLVARATDRALRPLFPRGFAHEAHLVGALVATDAGDDDGGATAALAINAASAALAVSDVPWCGPAAAIYVAYLSGDGGGIVVSPAPEIAAKAAFTLLFSGTDTGVTSLEIDARQPVAAGPLDDAIAAAAAAAGAVVGAIQSLAVRSGRPKREGGATLAPTPPFEARLMEVGLPLMTSAFLESAAYAASAVGQAPGGREDRRSAAGAARAAVVKSLRYHGSYTVGGLDEGLAGVERAALWTLASSQCLRPDGRTPIESRHPRCDLGVLPVVHGSALWERGETQSLAAITIAEMDDPRRAGAGGGAGQDAERLMVAYAAPKFGGGGEARVSGSLGASSTQRRELDASSLITRALEITLPDARSYPFSARAHVDALAAGGGSPMAGVCAASLALRDAGVPVTSLVAGIDVGGYMGPEEGKATTQSVTEAVTESLTEAVQAVGAGSSSRGGVIIVDPTGLEAARCDYVLSVAGTRAGLTALQLDARTGPVPLDTLTAALAAARGAMVATLDAMDSIRAPVGGDRRKSAAPQQRRWPLTRDNVARVIGPGGATVKELQSRTKTAVRIGDPDPVVARALVREAAADGGVEGGPDAGSLRDYTHVLSATGGAAGLDALGAALAELLRSKETVVVGGRYEARVTALLDYGALMELLPSGLKGLLHVSEMPAPAGNATAQRVGDVVTVGQEITVACVGRDTRTGALKFSLKALSPQGEEGPGPPDGPLATLGPPTSAGVDAVLASFDKRLEARVGGSGQGGRGQGGRRRSN